MMKNTGIVRRIDELGRVVIPKELRRTMHIKEGEEMEVFVAPDDSLVLKKYSALKDYKEVAQKYVDVVKKYVNCACLICDGTEVVASSDRAIKGRILNALEKYLSERKTVRKSGKEAFSPVEGVPTPREIAVCPVVARGDVLGGVVLFGSVGETGQKLCEVTAGFLAEQFE